MAQKRMKINLTDEVKTETNWEQLLQSDINDLIQATPKATTNLSYNESICGSILHPTATNDPSKIFYYIRHGQYENFRRSVEVYHSEIAKMRNNLAQTVLHALVIHNAAFIWIRLMMMRGCDPSAQDVDGYTAAHYAIERDDLEMLKALTNRFHSQVKLISEQDIESAHKVCLNALTLRNKEGLTPFMLACNRESLKCLNYLIELGIQDSNIQDNFGETCLHYAVARRNMSLVQLLLNQCYADINGGDQERPSVLDVTQFVLRQQKSLERSGNDEIERLLLSRGARNRRTIRLQNIKRKGLNDRGESMATNLASLSLELPINGSIETSREYARLAVSLQEQGDLDGALNNFRNALEHSPEETLDSADYANKIAVILQTRGQNQEALEIITRALNIRIKIEGSSEEINRLKLAVDNLKNCSN